MTSAVTSRTRLHRFAEKRNSPAHSKVHTGLVTKISYIYVCSNPNIFLVRWAGYIAHMKESRIAYRFSVGRPEGEKKNLQEGQDVDGRIILKGI